MQSHALSDAQVELMGWLGPVAAIIGKRWNREVPQEPGSADLI